MTTDFSKNLKHVCAERVSIAQICREIGINQQQFNRYLSGAGMPSAHNLRRICMFFGLTEAELSADNATFIAQRGHLNKNTSSVYVDPFANAFPGDLPRLREYVGAYHTHFLSPSWPEHVMIGATFLHEQEGQVIARTIERGHAPDYGPIQRTRYQGKSAYHGSRIFVIEFENEHEGSITETVLYPSHRQQRTYLRGITMGLAWRPRRMPYSVRSIWKRMDATLTAKEILAGCGVRPIESRKIDQTVRSFLTEKTGLSGEGTSHLT